MEYILIIIVIILFFSFKSLQEKVNKNELLLSHVVTSLSYYEKFLLKNNILSQTDIHNARRIIKNNLSEKDFEKLKNLILLTDEDYSELLEVALANSKARTLQNSIKDAVYYKNNRDVREILKIIEKNNIENDLLKDGEEDHLKHPSADSWINHKYGKNYFFPDSE
ncbi:MAG: hypothetical protein KAT32_01850 [Candidatus Moranbacteria bacterium]|nr:hypothetical protein [Candidatus Moranbacteria bacterium]